MQSREFDRWKDTILVSPISSTEKKVRIKKMNLILPLTASQKPISSGVGGESRGRTVAPIDLARRRISHFEVSRTTIRPI